MTRFRLLLSGALMVGGLLSSTAAFAWQSPSAREPFDFEAIGTQTSDDELVLQDKAPPKPVTPAKPPPKTPTTPQPPATQPQRPPAPAPPAQPQPQFNPFANAQPNQPFLARLSRAPDMFGDFYQSQTAQFTTNGTAGGPRQELLHLPLAGGSQRFKNEHGRALPGDRIFGFYNLYTDAVQSSPLSPGVQSTSANVNRFVVGFEKTFFDGNASIELRQPLSSPISFASPDANFQTDTIGNLVVNLKAMLFSDESQAFSLGLAVNTPTGSDLSVALPKSTTSNFLIQNNAVHLIPYLAYQAAPSEDFFFNGFLQFDTPTNANDVRIQTGTGAGRTFQNSSLTDQTLMYVDTSFGYWLYRDPDAEWLNGLAGLLELHYTTALNNADIVRAADQSLVIGSQTGRLDTLNMAFGLHTQLGRSTILRTAYITPLRDGNHRFFDGEFTVAVIFRR